MQIDSEMQTGLLKETQTVMHLERPTVMVKPMETQKDLLIAMD